MRFRLPPETFAELARERRSLEGHDAFCVYGSFGIDAYLTRDGAVLVSEYDLNDPDFTSSPLREAGAQEAIGILVAAAERAPQLRDVLPKRGDNTPACEVCRGSGWLTTPTPGLLGAPSRFVRAVRRALGFGTPRLVSRIEWVALDDDGSGATMPPSEIEYVPWRPGHAKTRVCMECRGLGWRAFL